MEALEDTGIREHQCEEDMGTDSTDMDSRETGGYQQRANMEDDRKCYNCRERGHEIGDLSEDEHQGRRG